MRPEDPRALEYPRSVPARPGRKIAIVVPDLAAGGMTRAYALAQALIHAGYGVEIIGVKWTKGDLYPLPPGNLPVTEVSGRNRIHSLLRLVKAIDGGILYAIKPKPSSFGVALLKRMINRVPVILDIDDWELAEMRVAGSGKAAGIVGVLKRPVRFLRRCLNPGDKRYISWLDGAICKADAITVDTRFLQQRYGGIYVPQCKDTARYDPDKYDPDDSRRRYGLSAYVVLMFPGTARPHKGLEDLLAAMDALQNPDVRLVIVGGRSSGDAYIAQLIQRWPQWIIRLPAVAQEKMPEIVAAAHAIVVPQRDTEIARAQFPMKLTDAMAMAKPIITTRVGDIPEVIGDSGYIVDPSSPGQLAVALENLIDDPQGALDRGRRARQRFVENYSLYAVGPVLSAVIETLN